MPYQEAWWAKDASLARLNFQRGTHGREGEHCGFPWEVGSRSEMALHRAGRHCGCRMPLHHRHCWLLFLKGLQVVTCAA